MRVSRPRARIKGTKIYVDAFTGTLGDSSLDYEAAGTGRRARSWRASSAGPNAALTYAQPNLVRRARDAVRKNALADRAANVIEINVVGTGITPQFRTPDAGLNRDLAELWLDWTDEADADGRLDFYGLQALATRAMFEAGEVFTRVRVRAPGDMGTVPLQVQLLESEFCPINEFRQAQVPGRTVRNGIEFDPIGRRTAYLMYRQHPYDWSAVGGTADLIPVFVPASEVLHIYELRRPGAVRGEPWLTRALIKLRDLDGMDDAQLMRAKVSNLLAGFITNPEPGETGFEGGPADAADAEGNLDIEWQPGTFAKLGPGDDIKFSNPPDVGPNYEVFMRQQLRLIAAAGRQLYEQLSGDYSTINDRTWRANVNEFRRGIEALQHNILVFQMCRPVVRRWLDLGVLSDAIKPPAGMDARALYRVDWLPQRWAYIHPVQDVQADRDEVRAGFASRSQKVAQRGYDPAEIDRETAADNERADSVGVAYDSDGRRPRSGGAVQTADAEERGQERETEDA